MTKCHGQKNNYYKAGSTVILLNNRRHLLGHRCILLRHRCCQGHLQHLPGGHHWCAQAALKGEKENSREEDGVW